MVLTHSKTNGSQKKQRQEMKIILINRAASRILDLQNAQGNPQESDAADQMQKVQELQFADQQASKGTKTLSDIVLNDQRNMNEDW